MFLSAPIYEIYWIYLIETIFEIETTCGIVWIGYQIVSYLHYRCDNSCSGCCCNTEDLEELGVIGVLVDKVKCTFQEVVLAVDNHNQVEEPRSHTLEELVDIHHIPRKDS